MTTPTKTFFDDLAQRGPRAVAGGGAWTVVFDNGNVRVDRDDPDADAVVRMDRVWFNRAVTGEEKLMPAVLRGEISLDSGYGLVVKLSRLLPGPYA